jgi:hypothetical protein
MKQKAVNFSGYLIIAAFNCCLLIAVEQENQTMDLEQSGTGANVAQSHAQAEADQLQELREKLVAMQAQILDADKMAIDEYFSLRSKPELSLRSKLCKFCKENLFNICSLTCTIIGMYMSYRYNQESLQYTRASFIIDKGEAAIKHIALVQAGQYLQYKTFVDKSRQQAAA